ncbi:MAG: TRAP transporter small permease [Burkholderiales bacterium]|nr:TRAP transporter small permease [Burkholderiales bacterium]
MSRFGARVRDGAAHVSRVFAWCGGALILASALLITLDVIARNLVKSTFFESFELTGYAFAISTAFGFAYAFFSKAHIRIEVLYNLLPRSARAWLDVVSVCTLAAIAVTLTWWAAQTVLQNASGGARSNSSMALPLAIPQSIWLLGLAWFALAVFVSAGIALGQLLRGRVDAVVADLGVATLDEEIAASVDAPPGGAKGG